MKAVLLAGLLATPAWAHGPTPQEVRQTIEIAAPPARVWEILADPAGMADWHTAVQSVTVEGEVPGARRTTRLENGSVVDGIDIVNPETMTTRWRLAEENHEVIPVSFYTNTLVVKPAGDASQVEWRASFFRADTTNEPVAELSDDAAVAFMETYVSEGLAGLKAAAEAN